jgi:hypothetical protein
LRRAHAYYLLYRRLDKTIVSEPEIRITYPYHPHYGKTLSVLEAHLKAQTPGYLCRITETSNLFVPLWMTCREAESETALGRTPQIPFATLLKVAEYLRRIEDVSKSRPDQEDRT